MKLFYSFPCAAPSGLAPPYLIVLNQTALRVAWTAPEQPNGQVTSYILYKDGQAIQLNTNVPGSIEVGGLLPYTIYIFQVRSSTAIKQNDCSSW
jgi:usherin